MTFCNKVRNGYTAHELCCYAGFHRAKTFNASLCKLSNYYSAPHLLIHTVRFLSGWVRQCVCRLVTHVKDDLAQAWNWQQQSVACMVVRLGRMYQSRSDVLSDRKVLAEFS